MLWSGLHEIREVFDLMPTEGEEAVANIAARLAAVPAALEGYRAHAAERPRKGNVAAARQYAEVAEQCAAGPAAGDGGDFFAGLVARLEADGAARRARAHAAAASARDRRLRPVPARRARAAGPRARRRVGRERYALAVALLPRRRRSTSTRPTPGAGSELQRLCDEMAETADRIVPGADVDEAVAHLDADPRASIHGSEAVPRLDAGARRPDHRRAGRHPLRHPRAGPPDRVLLAPTTDGGIYYTGPSEDFTRPGRMWWAVPEGIDDFHLARGHDRLPRGRARPSPAGRADRLPQRDPQPLAAAAVLVHRPRRGLGAVRRAADGRARLPRRPGRQARHARRPGASARPGSSSTSACTWSWRSRGDNPFGFHPGETWTPELGREFMRQHCRMDDEILRFEVKRYLGWPGQAPSYKVGERIWLEARADAQAAPGRRLRPQGVPPRRPRPRLARPRPAEGRARPPVSARPLSPA